MTDQADQTIVLRFLIDAKEILERNKQIREQVNGLKAEMKNMAADGKSAYADIARSMIEVSKIKMDTNIASLKAELSPLVAEYNRLKGVVQEEARQTLATIEAKKAAINSERQTHNQYAASVRTGLQEINRESRQLESSMKGAGGASGSLVKSLGGMAGTAIGITSIVMLFQKLSGYLKEAAQAGKEFAQATFSMVVGVRALQRAGTDITIADVTKQIQILKKEFGIFTTKDLVVGTSAFLNLNRDMGFTRDELFKLQEAIATLAIINGRSMDEVQKTVALALSSGYTEGLQRLGVSINRVTIAQEALNLGYEGGYTALNEIQRGEATYNEIIRKTNIYQEDLLEYQKTLPGQIDATTAALEDQKNMIGEELLPVWLQFLKVILEVVTFFREDLFSNATQDMTEYVSAYKAWLEAQKGGELTTQEATHAWTAAVEEYREIMRQLEESGEEKTIDEIIAERFGTPGLGDVPVADLADERLAEQVSSVIEDQLDEIKSIQEDFQEDSKEAWEDYQQDLEQLELDHFRRREELFRDFIRKIDELRREHDRRVDELELDNARRIDDINREYDVAMADLALEESMGAADIWANYYNSLASAEANYRNRQIDAETKYQETLLRLREGFLLDLEDALQVRDARQVLKLIRRYNLEKEQADRAFDQEMDRLRREHEERLAELARQRDERLRQFYEELAAKRATLELEHIRKLEDEKRRFEQEKAEEDLRYQQQRDDAKRNWGYAKEDEKIRYEQDKEDRDARYTQELLDLDAHLQSRYDKIALALGEELGYTDEMMEAVRVALNDTLGPGGEADAIYSYYTQRAVAAMQSAAGAISYISALENMLRRPGSSWWLRNMDGDDSNFVTPEDKPIKLGMANGGIAVADKPTNVTFGEAGTELAAFVPLKDIASIPSALANIGKGMGASTSGGGNMRIELWLDRYLEGRIVDSAVDNVADVILRRFRS